MKRKNFEASRCANFFTFLLLIRFAAKHSLQLAVIKQPLSIFNSYKLSSCFTSTDLP